jgi:hypothetical protein
MPDKPQEMSKAQAERVAIEVRSAIEELRDAVGTTNRNELGMRAMMGLIYLSNAFMEADYPPLEMLIPCGEGNFRLLTWMAAPGPRQRRPLGADHVDSEGKQIDLFTDRNGNPLAEPPATAAVAGVAAKGADRE